MLSVNIFSRNITPETSKAPFVSISAGRNCGHVYMFSINTPHMAPKVAVRAYYDNIIRGNITKISPEGTRLLQIMDYDVRWLPVSLSEISTSAGE